MDSGARRELPALGLAEAGLAALGDDLAHDRALERSVGRLAAGRFPVALFRGDLDDLAAGNRLLGLGEYPGRGVHPAGTLGLGLAPFGAAGGLLGLGAQVALAALFLLKDGQANEKGIR